LYNLPGVFKWDDLGAVIKTFTKLVFDMNTRINEANQKEAGLRLKIFNQEWI
jgi:hypothetical protein